MIIDIWAVHTSETDCADGKPTHFFSNEEDATTFAIGRGYYGRTAIVKKYRAIVLENKVYLIQREIDLDQKQEKRRKELREQAIAKLTPEELEALKYESSTYDPLR